MEHGNGSRIVNHGSIEVVMLILILKIKLGIHQQMAKVKKAVGGINLWGKA